MAKKKVAEKIPEIAESFNDILLKAVYNGDFEMTKWSLDMGADANSKDSNHFTPLMRACDYKGTIEIVKLLIENGAEVNVVRKYGHPPIAYATMNGHLEIIKYLVKSGADVNLQGEYGRTALHSAASPLNYEEYNKFEILKFLLENGADPNIKHNGGENPLMEASLYEDIKTKVVKLLIEYNTDLTLVNTYNETILSRFAERGRMDLVSLIEAEMENKEEISVEAMEKAILNTMNKDEWEMAIHLLKKSEGKLRKNFYRVSVLAHAARKDQTEIVQYLLDTGLDPSKEDINYGLEEACYYESFGIIKLLIENGAEVNTGGSENPLMKIARKGNLSIAKYLLDKGADIEACNSKGHTPLLFAAWQGQRDMVESLIGRGANINAKNELNWNALMQACVEGHEDVAIFLIENGSQLDIIDKEKGVTAFMLAVYSYSEKIVKSLIEHGADKTIKDKEGKTAADYARDKNNKKILKLLE